MDKLPELKRLQKLIEGSSKFARVLELGRVDAYKKSFPLFGLVFGPDDKTLPTLGLFGGVHGLERIGSQSVLAYLESLHEQMTWDDELRERFKAVRLVSIPIVNPAGMYANSRSNARGVDLMRNSPVEAPAPLFFGGGHRFSKWLPYYRGELGAAMEVEAQVLVDFVKNEMFTARAAMALDVHSGIGIKDRLWYPFARSKEPFPRIREVEEVQKLLDRSFPNHIYSVEPQSLSYTTHGDLWDYLFDCHAEFHKKKGPVFIPWTLEMGSWLWVRKNPLQLFSAFGRFNPIKIHRYRRILRRHLHLYDFMLRALRNYKTWTL